MAFNLAAATMLVGKLPTIQRIITPTTACINTGFIKSFHSSSSHWKRQAGLYRPTKKQDFPLTYEQANPPHYLAHRKSWNSWNTSNLFEGLRPSETATEDLLIRKFMYGTWHRLFLSEVIIKRRHNVIVIAGIIKRAMHPRRMYFLIGYTEEILSYFLKCPVKLELQSVADSNDVIFKYV